MSDAELVAELRADAKLWASQCGLNDDTSDLERRAADAIERLENANVGLAETIERLSAELADKADHEHITNVANAALAERDRLAVENEKYRQLIASGEPVRKLREQVKRLRAALERISKEDPRRADPPFQTLGDIAREALAVGHSHTESNQNDGYSQHALKGISAQHASEGIPDETECKHQWQYTSDTFTGKLLSKHCIICKVTEFS